MSKRFANRLHSLWRLSFFVLTPCFFVMLVSCTKSYDTVKHMQSENNKKHSHLPQTHHAKPSNINQKTLNRTFATDYQQFWLWTPPKSHERIKNIITKANTLYVLQGEIRIPTKHYANVTQQTATLTPQGVNTLKLPKQKVWLVYRASSDKWHKNVLPQLVSRLKTWQRMGNQVQGIQIDFDSPTYKLTEYAKLLKNIRTLLPKEYKISVTGLLDWANKAQDPSIYHMAEAVDELVMQTYQGKNTITNYPAYLKKMRHFPFPFKIGLVEHGIWYENHKITKQLAQNPNFKGYVVFLLGSL